MTTKERISSYRNEYFDELIAYHTERKEAPKNAGISYALRAYYRTNEYGLTNYSVTDMPFEQNMGEFLDTLAQAGITAFNLCDGSSGLMTTIHYLVRAGWQIGEPFEQEIDCYTTLYGLRMKKA